MQTPYAGNPYAPGQAPGREAKTPFQRRPAALGAATPTLPLALEGGPVRNESTTKRPTPAVTETPAQAAPTLLDVLLQQAATPAPRQAVGPARPEDLFRPELQTGQAYDAKALTPEARAAEDPLFWIVGNKQANPYTPPAAAGPQPRLGPQLGGGSGGVSSILQQLLGGNDIFSGSGQPPQNPRGGYDLPLPGGGTTPFFPGSPVNTPSGVPGSLGAVLADYIQEAFSQYNRPPERGPIFNPFTANPFGPNTPFTANPFFGSKGFTSQPFSPSQVKGEGTVGSPGFLDSSLTRGVQSAVPFDPASGENGLFDPYALQARTGTDLPGVFDPQPVSGGDNFAENGGTGSGGSSGQPVQGSDNFAFPLTGPGGIIFPGSQDWTDLWNALGLDDTEAQRNPVQYFLAALQSLGLVGGLWNPFNAFAGLGSTVPEIGQSLLELILGPLGGLGLHPSDAPQVVAPELNLDLFDQIFGRAEGAGYKAFEALKGAGREAAGYIVPPNVTSIEDAYNIFRSLNPEQQRLLGLSDAEVQRIRGEQDQGYGILGFPVDEVNRRAKANLQQVGFADQVARRQLGESAAQSGQFGQGAALRDLGSYFANQYAPARVEAVDAPWREAYAAGPPLLQALTGANQATAGQWNELALNKNLTDQQQRLQAQIAQSQAFGSLAGQGGQILGSLLNTGFGTAGNLTQYDAGLRLNSQLANLEAFLGQQRLFAGLQQGNLFAGLQGLSQAGADYNNMLVGLYQTALQEALASEARQDARDARKDQWTQLGIQGLGSLVGTAVGGPLVGGLSAFFNSGTAATTTGPSSLPIGFPGAGNFDLGVSYNGLGRNTGASSNPFY